MARRQVILALIKWHLFKMYGIIDRAWQSKIHTLVKEESHKVEIYSCFLLLMTEEDKDVFSHHLQLFLQYWNDKEPSFTQYFQSTYASRAGYY